MKDNLPPKSDAGRLTIVPSPVVIATRDDCIRAARHAPIVERPDCDNIVIVMAAVTAESVIARTCQLIVTHHIKSHRTKREAVAGSWNVQNVPIVPTDQRHVFHVDWPPDK